MKKFILSIIVIFCFYPVANADNSNVKLKIIRETEQTEQFTSSILQEKSLAGVGFELSGIIHKYRRQEKIESVGLILEGRTLRGQITDSLNLETYNVQKDVFEIGIRIDW